MEPSRSQPFFAADSQLRRFAKMRHLRQSSPAQTRSGTAQLTFVPPNAASVRTVEVEQLPAAAHYGVGVVPYSPLARGILSGKYAAGSPPPKGSRVARGHTRMHQTEWRPESLEIAEKIGAHAVSKGWSTISFALAWVLNSRSVTSIIAGPRTIEQWQSYQAALEIFLDVDDEALVDALVPPGHASTAGYTDPAYPVEGRIVR